MTSIDFHVNIDDKLGYTCRLARKAYAQNKQVVVFSSDLATLEELDRQLWSFSATDFIPHCLATHCAAAHTPVLLASDAVLTPHHDVLVNLDLAQPEFFSRFDRLIEIVGNEDAQRSAGRARWKFYEHRGYTLTNHDVSKSPS